MQLWTRTLACLFAVTALPAGAAVVEFDATYNAGIGDGGAPPTTPTISPNGLPICNKGLIAHLNASVPGHGFATLGMSRAEMSPAAPQTLMALRPFALGGPGSTGPGAGSTSTPAPGVRGRPSGRAPSGSGDSAGPSPPTTIPPGSSVTAG